jgi:hypothetical protein
VTPGGPRLLGPFRRPNDTTARARNATIPKVFLAQLHVDSCSNAHLRASQPTHVAKPRFLSRPLDRFRRRSHEPVEFFVRQQDPAKDATRSELPRVNQSPDRPF